MTDTIHVCGLSGGKDSTALALWLRQNKPELNVLYFFADTGNELPEVYEMLDKLEHILEQPIERLQPTKSFNELIEHKGGYLPAPRMRYCTTELKLKPIEAWFKTLCKSDDDKIISYVGIRVDEPQREAMRSKGNVSVELPFQQAGIDRQGVIDILDKAGIGLPAYYEWRSRSGCYNCFFQTQKEWLNLMTKHPDLYDKAEAMERLGKKPFTWNPKFSLAELKDNKELQERIEAQHERRLYRHDFNKRQYNLFLGDHYTKIGGGNGGCNVCHR